MSQETVSIRTDSTLKRQVAALSERLGFNTTTAVNMFFRAFIQTGGLPFDVVADPLSDPEERQEIITELKRRVAEAEEPGAKWYSLAEVRRELGL